MIPVIPDEEFRQRKERAAALTAEAGYDVLLVNSTEADYANVRYFCDYWPIFEIAGVAISPAGEACALIGLESEAYAQDRSKIENIHMLVEYRESADPQYPDMNPSSFRQAFESIGVTNPKRIGIGGYLVTTAPVLDGLREAFPEAELIRADDIMVTMRSIKSEAEVACQRKAFEISETAIEAVLDAIKPGMTELQVCGIVQHAIYMNGAEYEGMPQYVLSGPNSRHAISRPTHRVIEAGEMVQLNLSALVSGYSSGVGVPVCMGKMTPEMRDLVEFGLEVHEETIQRLRAGVVAGEIAKWHHQYFVDNGRADNFLYGPCHGLGMIEVEPPWMETNSEYALEENMTFQVDSFFYCDAFGLRWENGGRVTADGFDLYSGKFRRVIELEG
ncbi:MAG: M24 family metallopeptidase [Planctomycetota bacterium]